MSAIDEIDSLAKETAELVGEITSATCLYSPREHVVQAVVLAAVAGGVGFAVGSYLTKRRVEAECMEILNEEIAEAKAFYARLNKKGMETPEKARETLHPDETSEEEDPRELDEVAKAVRRYQGKTEGGTTVTTEIDEEESKVTVIMEDHPEADEGWDYEVEEQLREENPGDPFIIHLDEFMENEYGHEQVTLTFYRGDQTLADDQEEAIPYADPIVGNENLEKFGHGSGDPRIVFVRNERLSTDFEIALADGKYAHEVLGLEHSEGGARAHQRRKELRKFRGDRE